MYPLSHFVFILYFLSHLPLYKSQTQILTVLQNRFIDSRNGGVANTASNATPNAATNAASNSVNSCNSANGYRSCTSSNKNTFISAYEQFGQTQEYNVHLPTASRLIEEHLGPGKILDERLKNPADIIKIFAEKLGDILDKPSGYYGNIVLNSLTSLSPPSLNEIATFVLKYGDALLRFLKSNPIPLRAVMQQMFNPIDDQTNGVDKKNYSSLRFEAPTSTDVAESRKNFVRLGYRIGSLFKLGTAYAHIFLGIVDEILLPAGFVNDFERLIEEKLMSIEDGKQMQLQLSPVIVEKSEIKNLFEQLKDVGVIVSRTNYHKTLLTLFSSVLLIPLNLQQDFELIVKSQLILIQKFYLLRLILGFLFSKLRPLSNAQNPLLNMILSNEADWRELSPAQAHTVKDFAGPPQYHGRGDSTRLDSTAGVQHLEREPSINHNEKKPLIIFEKESSKTLLLMPILQNVYNVANTLLSALCADVDFNTGRTCQTAKEAVIEECTIEQLDSFLMLIGKLSYYHNNKILDRKSNDANCNSIKLAFQELRKNVFGISAQLINDLLFSCNNQEVIIRPRNPNDEEPTGIWGYLCTLAKNKLYVMCFEALETSKATNRCVGFVEKWGDQCSINGGTLSEKMSPLLYSVLSQKLDQTSCVKVLPAIKSVDGNLIFLTDGNTKTERHGNLKSQIDGNGWKSFANGNRKTLKDGIPQSQVDLNKWRSTQASENLDVIISTSQTNDTLNEILKVCLSSHQQGMPTEIAERDDTNNTLIFKSAIIVLCQLVHAKVSIFCASLGLGNPCTMLADAIKRYCLTTSTNEAANFLDITSRWVENLPLSNIICDRVQSDLEQIIWPSLNTDERIGGVRDLSIILQSQCTERSMKNIEGVATGDDALEDEQPPPSKAILCANIRGRLSNVCFNSLNPSDCIDVVEKIHLKCTAESSASGNYQFDLLYGPTEVGPQCDTLNMVVSNVLKNEREDEDDSGWLSDVSNINDGCLKAYNEPVQFLANRERLCHLVKIQSHLKCTHLTNVENCTKVSDEIENICIEYSDASFWQNLLHILISSRNKMELLPLGCLLFFGTINRIIQSAERSVPIVNQIVQECFNRSIY